MSGPRKRLSPSVANELDLAKKHQYKADTILTRLDGAEGYPEVLLVLATTANAHAQAAANHISVATLLHEEDMRVDVDR